MSGLGLRIKKLLHFLCEFCREADDKSCFRYIMGFKCDKIRLHKDEFSGQETEFLTILITGQSFMLHQIRKMIGLSSYWFLWSVKCIL